MKITSKDIILDTDERIRMHSEPVTLPLSNEDKVKVTKKVSRESFLDKDTTTKVFRDKTIYNRKDKYKKPLK